MKYHTQMFETKARCVTFSTLFIYKHRSSKTQSNLRDIIKRFSFLFFYLANNHKKGTKIGLDRFFAVAVVSFESLIEFYINNKKCAFYKTGYSLNE